MRLALAQVNVVVGDLDGNQDHIIRRIAEARGQRADLVVFPELAVTGYPPEDLLLRPGFVSAVRSSLHQIAQRCTGIAALVGVPLFADDLYNCCAVLADGAVRAVYRKHYLPNYGVFDEHRYFAPGRDLLALRFGDVLVGPTICEDVWEPGPPATDLALAGVQLLVNLSASPFHVGKAEEREEMLVTRARDNACFLAFCNLVGGQDELVFDGHSVVLDDAGEVIARAPGFEEALLFVDVEPTDVIARRLRDVRLRALGRSRSEIPEVEVVELAQPASTGSSTPPSLVPFEPELEQMRRALVLGLHDYVEKNGFSEIVLGISGGIDSALTAALCVDALGAAAVHCVSMPSRFSSEGTRSDAQQVAENLGCAYLELPIEPVAEAFRELCCNDVTDGGPTGSRRGESPGAHPRHAADGALQHLRLAGRLDGQQVGARGRVLDPVRGHGRRLRPAEGRVQDRRLEARELPERARGTRADTRVDDRP